MDEPLPETLLSVAGQTGAIYSAGVLQLSTKLAVWSEIDTHTYIYSFGSHHSMSSLYFSTYCNNPHLWLSHVHVHSHTFVLLS